MTSYVDFYKKHNVCPVSNVADPLFLKKRAALYFQLGVAPAFLKGKKVIEFGPGNAINSLYTQSLEPSKYVLVDANPTSLINGKANFEKAFPEYENYEFAESLIEKYTDDEKYDLVICEGLIPHQYDPTSCAKHVASFTQSGGLFILTCHDFISVLGETLRAFLAYISTPSTEFDEKVDEMTALIQDHFQVLKSMNRSHRDWVIDNAMQTDPWMETPLYSIVDAIETFKEDFSIFGCSPSFISDWRWYKDMTDENQFSFNDHAIASYWKNAHQFIDFRFHFPERSISDNQELYALAKETKRLIRQYMLKQSSDNQNLIIQNLQELHEQIDSFSEETAKALHCYIQNLKRSFAKEPLQFTHFQNWWGRGTQFLSLLKVS